MVEDGLFGPQMSDAGAYTVFQDESGTRGSDRWLILGFLFVPTQGLPSLIAALQRTRAECRCDYEIHYTELPSRCNDTYGTRSRAALRWMREYRSVWHASAAFTALAIDTWELDPAVFPTRFYMQNRFSVMGIKCGIAWHLKPERLSELDLTIVYDEHNVPNIGKTGYEDNYGTYVGPRLEQEIEVARGQGKIFYPITHVKEVLAEDSGKCLPLQLTDLLLGSVSQAVVRGASQQVKSSLGLMATHWCMDVGQSPWLQTLGMHRKLNLRAFPDNKNEMYDLVNVVQEASGDPELFKI